MSIPCHGIPKRALNVGSVACRRIFSYASSFLPVREALGCTKEQPMAQKEEGHS